MGIRSWFSGRRSADQPAGLVRTVPSETGDPRIDEMKSAAAAEVAAVEEDDKYFGPADPEDDL